MDTDDYLMDDLAALDHSNCRHVIPEVAAVEKTRIAGARVTMNPTLVSRRRAYELIWVTVLDSCKFFDSTWEALFYSDGNWQATEHTELIRALDSALVDEDLERVRKLTKYHVQVAATMEAPSKEELEEKKSKLAEAFQVQFQGYHHHRLLHSLDAEVKVSVKTKEKPTVNSLCVSLIQSSCTGKSRTTHKAASERFSLCFNLREELKDQIAYPPSDDAVRDFLLDASRDGRKIYPTPSSSASPLQRDLLRHSAFFEALFTTAAKWINTKLASSTNLPLAWQVLMEEKPVRSAFYHEVVDRASNNWRTSLVTGEKRRSSDELPGEPLHKKAELTTLPSVQTPQIDLSSSIHSHSLNQFNQAGVPMSKTNSDEAMSGSQSTDRLVSAADLLIDVVKRYKTEEEKVKGQRAEVIVFIDEAHPLTESSGTHTRTGLLTMEKLFKTLRDRDLIVVFLSTNSKMEGLAPPVDKHPSFRDRTNDLRRLIPPLTEFCPFDVYVKKKDRFTLNDCTNLEFVSAFGRPVWGAMYQSSHDKKSTFRKIIDFAQEKLAPRKDVSEEAEVAWTSILVMLKFDLAEQDSRVMASKLVESYLRIVFCVPDHRHFMETGTPSEPMLAEAAALLIGKHGVNTLKVLRNAFNSGLIAKGERGEILTRHLLIKAQQRAAKIADVTESGFLYHRPLPLLAFLRALLTPEAFEIVRKATPVDDTENKTTFEVAFKDAFINFSHFSLAGDFKVVEIDTLRKFFARGTALQCADNQRMFDSMAPTAFASDLDSPLEDADMSVAQFQSKNRQVSEECILDTSIVFPDGRVPHRPVLSLVFELGLEKKKYPNPILMPKSYKKATRSHLPNPQSQNYQITIMGLDALQFEDQDQGMMIEALMAGKLFQRFPRNDNWDLLMKSYPAWFKDSQMDWI